MRRIAPLSLLLVLGMSNTWAKDEIIGSQAPAAEQPGNFMDGKVGQWSQKRLANGDSFELVEHVAGEPWAGCFQLAPDDKKISDGHRAELRDLYVADQNERVEYDFSTYIPSKSGFDGAPRTVLAQWHDRKTNDRPSQRPPLSLRVVDNELWLILWNDQIWAEQGQDGPGVVLLKESLVKDQWLHQRYRIQWSANDEGRVEVWWNDKRVLDYHGPVGYEKDQTQGYFKFGVYTTHALDRSLEVCHTGFQRSGW
ncbi:polysaccharide lyase [Pokkaliibacter sp. CJK22405]|uniref:polysaccharide lyase n=1 Tax=Pokkaliibacter sp. CJK22405 TaxID=3384615 RepID=UPI0039853593